MKKLVRYVLYFIGFLVFLIIAAVLLAPRFVDPNDFKPQITSLIKQHTGRDIVIDGDIKLSVFPWIGVSLGKVELKELPDFGVKQFVALNSADIKVKLLPLLSKQVEVDRVSIDGLTLNLVRLENGIANWETLSGPATKQPDTTEPEQKETTNNNGKPANGLAALSLAGLSLNNAYISYNDKTAPQHAVIEQLNLNIDKVGFNHAIPFDADFIATVSQPQLKDKLSASGKVTLNETLDQFTLNDLKLKTDLEGQVVKQGLIHADLQSGQIEFDKNTLAIQIASGLKLAVNGKGGELPAAFKATLNLPDASITEQLSQIQLGALDLDAHLEGEAVKQGQVTINLNSDSIQFNQKTLSAKLPSGLKLVIKGGGGELPDTFNANLNLPSIQISNQNAFDLGQLSLTAQAEGEQFPGGKLDASLTSNVSGNLASQTLSLPNIKLSAADLNLTGNLSGNKIIDAPAFTGQISVDSFNARRLLESLGIELPEMQDQSALTQLALNSDINFGQQAAGFKKLNIQLDDSVLTGSAAINDFASQAITFNLKLDNIDVDRYLPPQNPNKTKKDSSTQKVKTPAPSTSQSTSKNNDQAQTASNAIIPVEAIQKLNMDGQIVIDQVKINGLKASNVRFKVSGKDGKLEAKPSIGKFYQGAINAGLFVNTQQATPSLKINNSVANIAIEKLLKEMTKEDYISGTANMGVNLTARGLTEQALTSSLNGKITANFLDGAIYGINIPKMIRDGLATLQGQAADNSAANKTDFSELNMLSNIKNGVITTDNLELKSPLLRVLGKGKLDLNTKKLEYRTSVKLVDTLKGQGGNSPTDLTGIPIPLLITGTLDNIRYELDIKTAAQEALKTKAGKKVEEKANAVIEKNKAKVMDKINKKLGDKLGSDLEKGAGELLKGLF